MPFAVGLQPGFRATSWALAKVLARSACIATRIAFCRRFTLIHR